MIESMAEGGPSHASGQMQIGDILLEVDGIDVRAFLLKEIQSKIIGRTGTQVTLTLQRGKRSDPHKVTLTRSSIKEASKTEGPGVAEVGPASFKGNSRYIEALSDRARPHTIGVPPIYGQRDLVPESPRRLDDAHDSNFNLREKSLDAKADYWREKYHTLERAMTSQVHDSDQPSMDTVTKLKTKIAYLEAELDLARRSTTGGGADVIARLDGQIKVLRIENDNLEQARLREEKGRIDAENELRQTLVSGKSAEQNETDRLHRLQTMLDAERKERAALEKRMAQLNARLEEFRQLDAEKQLLDEKLEELRNSLTLSRAEAARHSRARHLAEETIEQMQSGHASVDQLMAQRIKDLLQQLEDERKELRQAENLLAKTEAEMRGERQRANNQKKHLELQIQDLQDELDRKKVEANDLQATLGIRSPQVERSSELIDAQKKIRKLLMDLESAQTIVDDNAKEIRRLKDLLHQADATLRLEDLHKELQAEQERRQHEMRQKIKEHEARNHAEEQLAMFKSDENKRSLRLESMLHKIEKDLEMSSERAKKLELERHELARSLMQEKDEHKSTAEELSEQNRKLAAKVESLGRDLAEVEDKFAKLQVAFKHLEQIHADTKSRLELRVQQLEEYETKSETKLINTRRAMEQDEMLVQKIQRELDDWMEKCSQAEKRRDQLDFTLRRKEEELADSLTDAQAERTLRQKLEINLDHLKHQNTLLKDELRDTVKKLESQLAETSTLLELEQVSRRKADEKVEELRGSLRHLSLKSDGLEDKTHDQYDRLKAVEAQRDRLEIEVQQLEEKLNAASKELMTKMRAADDEISKLRDQIQEDSHEVARERREKHTLERQLADAKYECRKVDTLQHRVDDLQVAHQKEVAAKEEAEAARQKAQKFAESVTEWDRALQEKNQRLESRIESLEKELATAQIKRSKTEILASDAQDTISKDAKQIAELKKEGTRLTDELDRLMIELQEQRSHCTIMRDKFESEQALARRKTEELEILQRRIEELTDILERDKHLQSQIGSEEERLRREVDLLKRNLVRADEISSDERKMRQDLQKELDLLKSDLSRLNESRFIDHRVASEDVVMLRQQVETLSKERDEAAFKATQHSIRFAGEPVRSQKDEEMILLLAENAKRDEELISRLSAYAERDAQTIIQLQSQAEKDEQRLLHLASHLKMAEEELELACQKLALKEKNSSIPDTRLISDTRLLHAKISGVFVCARVQIFLCIGICVKQCAYSACIYTCERPQAFISPLSLLHSELVIWQDSTLRFTVSPALEFTQSHSDLEKELYTAQDAVFELKQRSAQQEDDNQRLEKALQNAQSTNSASTFKSSKEAELERCAACDSSVQFSLELFW